jgi:ornithine cyclodeaminase
LCSRGDVQVAAVGHLNFSDRPDSELYGDCCIKSGAIYGDDNWVVKVATGNWNYGPNGVMLVLEQKTGALKAVLHDEGFLTDLRTAVSGAVAAKWLAPQNVEAIGIVGTGVQAKLQLEMLEHITPCRKVIVWGRSDASLAKYLDAMAGKGWEITATKNISDVTSTCNLIVTCTPSRVPLIDKVLPGTHITCVGADVKGKNELSKSLVASADLILLDSEVQCTAFGEVSNAVDAGLLPRSCAESGAKMQELGVWLAKQRAAPEPRQANMITIFDSTGVAVQDVQIASMVYSSLAE